MLDFLGQTGVNGKNSFIDTDNNAQGFKIKWLDPVPSTVEAIKIHKHLQETFPENRISVYFHPYETK